MEYTGLSFDEVKKLQLKYGKNQLSKDKKDLVIVLFFKNMFNFLQILLLICAFVEIIIDINNLIEGLVILFVVFFNSLLGTIQEIKSIKSMNSLKELQSPKSEVIRDGKREVILSSDLVVGDIVFAYEGDYIASDGIILESNYLTINESSLTGESEALLKKKEDEILSSSFVISGSGLYKVTKIGHDTFLGHIASSVDKKKKKTPLEKRLDEVGYVIGLIVLFIAVIIYFLSLLNHNDLFLSLKTSLALAVAAIPEGLSAIIAIILSLGVYKMSKKNVLVKRLPSIETIGQVNALFTDKTGTITKNRLYLDNVYPKESRKLILEGLGNASSFDIKLDQMDLAIKEKLERENIDLNDYSLVEHIPFDSISKRAISLVYKNSTYYVFKKGAILDLKGISKDFIAHIDSFENEGYKVIGVWMEKFDFKPNLKSVESSLRLVGIASFLDEIRPGVKESINKLHEAHVNTIMLTGDSLKTAFQIGKRVNMVSNLNECVDLSKEKVLDYSKYKIFARVKPKDKMNIIEYYKKENQTICMTGDGVNDAPALSKADISFSMQSGTMVSKEASDMILLDDSYSTIVDALKEGRTIYKNIKKTVAYLLSSNIGEVIAILISSILTFFYKDIKIPLTALELLFINLITDSLPAFGIGMEKSSDDILKEYPRRRNEPFFTKRYFISIILEGILIGFISFSSYLISYLKYHDDSLSHTMCFLTLSFLELFHSFNQKSDKSIFNKNIFNNKILNLSFLLGISLTLFTIYIPFLANIFMQKPLGIFDLIIAISLASIIIIYMELIKKFKHCNLNKNPLK